MNILKNYTDKICGFPPNVFESILNYRNDLYTLQSKCTSLHVILNRNNGKLINLPCINKIYTTNENNKPLKIAKNSSHCFNTFRAFDIEPSYNDCIGCHRQSLVKFNNKELKLIKK